MIALDASVVIAHLQPRDGHHKAASAYLSEHVDERLLMHPLTLAEVLVGGVRTSRGQGLLADLQAIGVEVAEWSDGASLRLATLRVETGLKLPDCCVLDTALNFAAELATFDDDLAQAARDRNLTVGPATALPATS